MFKFDTKWDVDKNAEALNTSLFGTAKRHRTKGVNVPSSTDLPSKSFSGILPDSDDECYSKKDKKRLKKWKKKNKISGRTDEDSAGQIRGSDVMDSLAVKKMITRDGKTLKVPECKVKGTSHIKPGSDVGNTKNKSKKAETFQEISRNATPQNKPSNRDRKRKLSENAQNDIGSSNKNKKAKVELNENTSSADATVPPTDVRKKRKRNRKKKNNSKKNKYKHLALNSRDKTVDENERNGGANSSISRNFISDKTSHQTTDSDKSFECALNRNSVPSDKVPSSQSEILIKKDTVSGDQFKDSALLSRSENGSMNTKHILSDITRPGKDVLPTQKKKKKDHAKDQTSVNNSQSLTIRKTSVIENLHSHSSKPLVNSKLKKHVLLKMLNEPDKAKNSKNHLTSEKKNMPGETSILKKPDTSIQWKPKQEHKDNIGKGSKKENISGSTNIESKISTASPVSRTLWGKAAELGQQAKAKLNSARFRYINEQLYSCTGGEALKMFRDDPRAFSVYHEGFENQVNKWPVNPLSIFIKQIKDKPKNLVIADFGCGDAKLAQSIPQKVHSFDLVALNDRITVCDMSKTPLPGESVDVAVFCLSLMGTNISDYIREANRVLKTSGLLKMAEVVSRFRGLSTFIEGVCSHGFQLLNKRDINQMFYLMDFKKIKSVKKSMSLPEIKLKPCVYKRR